jgi:protoporphyrinogen oxidase
VKPRVAIIGGGILGMSAAYRLAKAGVSVAVFERSRDLGGLVGTFDLGGTRVDRFYHVILPTDDRVIGLAREMGLGERFRFRPTKVGFYGDGRLFSMTSPLEFARFPLFGPVSRARLASFVLRCQLTTSYTALDDEPLLAWLRRGCGQHVTEKLWKPLLDSKFDGRYDDLPATYIWARSRRMSTTRDRSGREVMGWIEGGYQTLIDALEKRTRELGGKFYPGAAVGRVVAENGRATGVVVDGTFVPADFVLCTLVPPQARAILAPELAMRVGPDRCRYLGVVCLVLRVSRSVSPYYHLNITDRRVPLTTVVETTHVVDPDAVGGHLLYVSKYVDPSHEDLERPPEEIEAEFRDHARTIFPTVHDDEILASSVQRARITEPVHLLGGAKHIPALFAAPGLALASTAHVYPEIVSGQAVLGVSERVVSGILSQLDSERREAA